VVEVAETTGKDCRFSPRLRGFLLSYIVSWVPHVFEDVPPVYHYIVHTARFIWSAGVRFLLCLSSSVSTRMDGECVASTSVLFHLLIRPQSGSWTAIRLEIASSGLDTNIWVSDSRRHGKLLVYFSVFAGWFLGIIYILRGLFTTPLVSTKRRRVH